MLVPPIKSKRSHGFGRQVRSGWPSCLSFLFSSTMILCISSLMISSSESPRMPPPSAQRLQIRNYIWWLDHQDFTQCKQLDRFLFVGGAHRRSRGNGVDVLKLDGTKPSNLSTEVHCTRSVYPRQCPSTAVVLTYVFANDPVSFVRHRTREISRSPTALVILT